MSRVLVALLTLTFITLGGCVTSPSSSPEKIKEALSSQSESLDQYILGPTDVVEVSVWRNPDLSTSVPVRPDGRISVPLVGDIQASGRAPEELAAAIETGLAEYLREPQVSVVVKGMSSHEFSDRVRVTGAVKGPQSVPFREGMTVLDIVLGAGGPNPFAALNNATLYRPFKGEVVAIPVHLDDILTGGNIETNYHLQPGDILTIPERKI